MSEKILSGIALGILVVGIGAYVWLLFYLCLRLFKFLFGV